MVSKIETSAIACYKLRGGKNSLWQARYRVNGQTIIGSGATADYAIRDLRQQIKRRSS